MSNPYRLNGLFRMPEKCASCGQRFHLEPSFYYGAMYVNYALTVAIGVAVFVAMFVLGNFSKAQYLVGILAALVVTAPFTVRLGRSIWISFFVAYEPDPAKRL